MPVKGNILYCPNCNHPHPQINLVTCLKCGHDLGAPNVNMVSTEEEINALQKRYEDALNEAGLNGTGKIINEFELYFNTHAKAIKNLPFAVLHAAAVYDTDYQSYYRSVELGQRSIAKPTDDQKRSVLDSFLYGSYGKDMNYATLTLNNKGLYSYGDCAIIFNEDSIKFRSSVLEENSYKFVETHKINFELLNIPPGYRSTWQNKLKLTIAKLYKRFKTNTIEADFASIVLHCNGDRDLDQFLEVHIYKELTNLAVRAVFIPVPGNKNPDLYVKSIESKLPGKVTRI